MDNLPAYRKTVAALVTGVIGWAIVVVASEPSRITASEWIQLAVAGATALGVYGVTNEANDGGLTTLEVAVYVTAVLVLILFGDAVGWWTLSG